MRCFSAILVALPALALTVPALGQETTKTFTYSQGVEATPKTQPKSNLPRPTYANVSYGPHERNGLDFWQAKTKQPAGFGFHSWRRLRGRQQKRAAAVVEIPPRCRHLETVP